MNAFKGNLKAIYQNLRAKQAFLNSNVSLLSTQKKEPPTTFLEKRL